MKAQSVEEVKVDGAKVDVKGGGGRRKVVKLAYDNQTLQRKLLRGR